MRTKEGGPSSALLVQGSQMFTVTQACRKGLTTSSFTVFWTIVVTVEVIMVVIMRVVNWLWVLDWLRGGRKRQGRHSHRQDETGDHNHHGQVTQKPFHN